MFEGRVFRGVFGSKPRDGEGQWRKLHSEEHHKFALFAKHH
jgi:hypothetical protein